MYINSRYGMIANSFGMPETQTCYHKNRVQTLSIAVIRPNPFFRPYVIPCHPKPNPLTVSENAQIRFILRFILLFSYKTT